MRKILLTLALWLCATVAGFCQTDTVIYLNNNYKPVPKEQAVYYRLDRITDAATGKGYRKDFYISGEQYQEMNFSKFDSVRDGAHTVWYKNGEIKTLDHYVRNKLHGKSEGWFEDGQVLYERHYDKNELHGEVKSYHANQQLRRRDLYAGGKLVEGHCYDENGTEVPHYPHFLMPQFPGGNEALFKYLGQSIKVPFGMRLKGAEGKALVSFIVDKYGDVSDVEVLQATHESLGKESTRVIKAMPKWAPGEQEGEKVSVRYTVPVRIKLAE